MWARFIFSPLLDNRVRVVDDGVPAAEYGLKQANEVHAKLKALGGIKSAARICLHGSRGHWLGRRADPSRRATELPCAVRRRDRGFRCYRARQAPTRGIQGCAACRCRRMHDRKILRLLGLLHCGMRCGPKRRFICDIIRRRSGRRRRSRSLRRMCGKDSRRRTSCWLRFIFSCCAAQNIHCGASISISTVATASRVKTRSHISRISWRRIVKSSRRLSRAA